MTYEFVQVTATKANGDFALCSNLSLMDNQGLTPKQALRELQVMADEYAAKGYNIEWTREVMDEVEIEMWGPLFDGTAA